MATRYLATLGGVDQELEVEETSAHGLRLKIGSREFEADVRKVGASSFSVLIGNRSFDLEVVPEGDELIVASRSASTRVTLVDTARRSRKAGVGGRPAVAGKAQLKAMMPGRVVNILVSVGDEVGLQQGLVVIEAMKMENELKSPKAGKVTEIKVTPGQTVEKGDLLIVVE
ncbi:MAG TPA: biotin/lipoyl-containing protein [Candidatus Binataceae bacterium]|nr:biotin/lipoyl-containing protein [Candidatus Binataceae bacterium]